LTGTATRATMGAAMTDVNLPGFHYHGPWEPFWQKVTESGLLYWIAGCALLAALLLGALILFAVAFSRRSQASPWPATPATAAPGANRSYAAILHLVTLPVIPFGVVVFFILWFVKRDEDRFVDAVGRYILNYVVSYFLFALLCVPFILVFGLGLVGLFVLWLCGLVCPIIGAIRASDGIAYEYPFSIRILQPPAAETPAA